jgi:methane monooxygenase PmoA-like
MRIQPALLFAAALFSCSPPGGMPAAVNAANVEFDQSESGKIAIRIGGQNVAVYVYQDQTIPRPYFAHVRTLDGTQVTRNHPPITGQDLDDHPDYHPGIWMAFGDISGNDYWRNKARVEYENFTQKARGGFQRGSFAVKFRYLDQHNRSTTVCEELVRYRVVDCAPGWLLVWDSTFSSTHPFYFGDQEEMGLGVRVATQIRVDRSQKKALLPGTGTMLDAQGRKNGDQIWGHASDWCDYSGTINGKHAGISIFCNPENFRPSWFHARDYGLLEANPFGRHAFGKGAQSKVVINPGASLRLQYGVYVYSTPGSSGMQLLDPYKNYLVIASKLNDVQDD